VRRGNTTKKGKKKDPTTHFTQLMCLLSAASHATLPFLFNQHSHLDSTAIYSHLQPDSASMMMMTKMQLEDSLSRRRRNLKIHLKFGSLITRPSTVCGALNTGGTLVLLREESGSVGQSPGLSIPISSPRFRQKPRTQMYMNLSCIDPPISLKSAPFRVVFWMGLDLLGQKSSFENQQS